MVSDQRVFAVALQCLSFSILTVCALAQDQRKETPQALPKPPEIGQVFSFKDGKLAPLCEEKHVSFWRTFSGEMLVRIKGAESPTRLDSSDKLTFLVHLPDKAVREYSLHLLKQEKDRRTMRRSKAEEMISFSVIEYADGYFQLTPRSPLPPGQYGFFFQQEARQIDTSYSFTMK
jgi:hypothetical protein